MKKFYKIFGYMVCSAGHTHKNVFQSQQPIYITHHPVFLNVAARLKFKWQYTNSRLTKDWWFKERNCLEVFLIGFYCVFERRRNSEFLKKVL